MGVSVTVEDAAVVRECSETGRTIVSSSEHIYILVTSSEQHTNRQDSFSGVGGCPTPGRYLLGKGTASCRPRTGASPALPQVAYQCLQA